MVTFTMGGLIIEQTTVKDTYRKKICDYLDGKESVV